MSEQEAKLMEMARVAAKEVLDESQSRGYTEAHVTLLATAYVRGFSAGMAQGEKLFCDAVAEALCVSFAVIQLDPKKETMQ